MILNRNVTMMPFLLRLISKSNGISIKNPYKITTRERPDKLIMIREKKELLKKETNEGECVCADSPVIINLQLSMTTQPRNKQCAL